MIQYTFIVRTCVFSTTEETQIPFLERRMSYPEDKAFSIDDISQMLQPMKCERHVSVLVGSWYIHKSHITYVWCSKVMSHLLAIFLKVTASLD